MELGDNDVEVSISFAGPRLRMTSDGVEIGDWPGSAYALSRSGEGTFRLEVEGDELTFRPASPREFAIAASVARARSGAEEGGGAPEAHVVAVGPPAGAVTMLLFYLLVAATVAMGIWAGLSLAAP